METIKKFVDYLEKNDLYPDLRVIEGCAEPEVMIDGKKVLMFSSNNYLSLSTHPSVKRAAIEAIEKYGTGSGGSRMLSGNLDIYRELEKKLTAFKGGEDAIVWPSGYSVNVGIMAALTDSAILKINPANYLLSKKGRIILSDELNHASIIDGCRMTKTKIVVYKHLDLKDLERQLKKYKKREKLIVTDGIFSMDGDIAPLDKISFLAKKYNAIIMVDEAHSTGVLGKTGRGMLEHFNLQPIKDVSIIMGTLSKALASAGGFVVGSKELIKYLRVASRPYIFSTAMAPSSAAAAIAAIEVIENEPLRREKLWENVNYFKAGLQNIGYDTLNSQSPIIPVLIGEDEKAIKFSRLLFEKGIFGPCVRWPAVEKGKARIRFTIMANHKKEQIDILLGTCYNIGKDLKII